MIWSRPATCLSIILPLHSVIRIACMHWLFLGLCLGFLSREIRTWNLRLAVTRSDNNEGCFKISIFKCVYLRLSGPGADLMFPLLRVSFMSALVIIMWFGVCASECMV